MLVKKLILMSMLLPTVSFSSKVKQFPKPDYQYRPRVDVGMAKYKNPSFYNTRKVALTYDDGPHKVNTPKILDILKEYNAKATFFVLTKSINAETMPIIKRIIDEGHNLASHDHDHDNNNSEPMSVFKSELTESISIIEKILDDNGVHQKEMYYRFPYGAYGRNRAYHHMNVLKEVSQELYGDNCLNFAFWDIDTADWVPTMTSEKVNQNILSHIDGGTAYTHAKVNGRWTTRSYRVNNPPGGGVVLLHDIQDKTVKATRLFLESAKEKNIEIVPLSYGKEFNYEGKECIFLGQ